MIVGGVSLLIAHSTDVKKTEITGIIYENESTNCEENEVVKIQPSVRIFAGETYTPDP
jgi:hypothetical protein